MTRRLVAACLAAALAATAGCSAQRSADGPTSAAAPVLTSPAPATSAPVGGLVTPSAVAPPSAPPITPRAPSPSTPAPVATAAPIPADSVDFGDPKAVAAGYLAAWCPYAWTEPQSARAARTAPFMTADAAAALDADTTWWASVVVATRTLASCAMPAVYSALGPNDPTHRYLRLQTTRQVTTTTGTAAETVLEQRVLVLGGDGRWLVDARVQGG